MPNENSQFHVFGLLDLVQLLPVAPGTVVTVEEKDHRYHAVGNLSEDVAQAIGWRHVNVWMPDNVYADLLEARTGPFLDPISVATALLSSPVSVHNDSRQSESLYAITTGERLRERGLLRSVSTPYVDAVIELRPVSDMILPRLFHLSPRKRNHGGLQLWP